MLTRTITPRKMLSFLKSIYRSICRQIKPTFPTPFPILYNPQYHETETLAYFKQSGKSLFRDITQSLTAKKQVVICFTNRCGSNWLAELLASTGMMGHADEFFNIDRIQETCAKHNLTSFDDFIRHLPNNHSTENGVFATKLSWDQLYFLTRIEVIPRLIKQPEFIYIIREDIAAQALSLLVAEQTGQWKSNWNSGINGKVNPDSISDEDIIEGIQKIQRFQSQFEHYFSTFQLQPYRVYYEQLMQQPEVIVAQILRYLGIYRASGYTIDPAKLTLSVQRNEQTEQRLALFHQNTGNLYAYTPRALAA